MSDFAPLQPGMTIGILGGGQLGRMLSTAAAELGFSTHIYCPDRDSPAFAVSASRTIAPYEDEQALAAFAEQVAVVTYEFENVPAATANFLTDRVAVYPAANALEVSQDRVTEKELMVALGIAVPAFAFVDQARDIYSALAKAGRPAVLKTRRFGYDGKGQAIVRTGDDPANAWRAIGEVPAILESYVQFEREISVILARGRNGEMRAYDVSENRHAGGILDQTIVPARITPALARQAVGIAERIAAALDYVGVLAVEMFVVGTGDGARLLVNEIAPRVHNSGHWTQDGALVSQFEQHIRAIAGWPLGDPTRHSDVIMTNLIGDDAGAFATLAAEPGARLHLYGKAETRKGRKMGHVNRVKPRST
jgi:5-(carboxyamino)imidazole ribonucleotide synthase